MTCPLLTSFGCFGSFFFLSITSNDPSLVSRDCSPPSLLTHDSVGMVTLAVSVHPSMTCPLHTLVIGTKVSMFLPFCPPSPTILILYLGTVLGTVFGTILLLVAALSRP